MSVSSDIYRKDRYWEAEGFPSMQTEPVNPLLKVAAPAGSGLLVIVHDSKIKRDNHTLILQPIFLLCYASRGAEEDVYIN